MIIDISYIIKMFNVYYVCMWKNIWKFEDFFLFLVSLRLFVFD